MANMSYCRFQNTLPDLRDCARAIEQGDVADLSDDEKLARRQLIALCRDIAEATEGERS